MGEGRWIIQGGVGRLFTLSGPSMGPGPVPVVPCDDEAIERAVLVLLADGGVDMTSEPPGETREDYARSVVEDVFRAAAAARSDVEMDALNRRGRHEQGEANG